MERWRDGFPFRQKNGSSAGLLFFVFAVINSEVHEGNGLGQRFIGLALLIGDFMKEIFHFVLDGLRSFLGQAFHDMGGFFVW